MGQVQAKAEIMSDLPNTTELLSHLSLGKVSQYKETYSPELLQGVPRSLNRRELTLTATLPFTGADRWNGYELSWLNLKGKPQIAILRCEVPYNSPNLIESKSFKLYLNSFNQSKIASIDKVTELLSKDLSYCAGLDVNVQLFSPVAFGGLQLASLEAECIDDIDIQIDDYHLQPQILKVGEHHINETLCSHLLKSNCLITNQPDWGSVLIHYHGKQIDKESLLRYLISFRQHNEFHEQCVERIFCDIMHYCQPQKLTVYARYTRRGGLDINPFRSNFESLYPEQRLARQ
ncbi:MAG: 7-cyano-7-deazaguanine reductase [Paraglaciecola sp.]|jgi:7-cyano-7-deazaguanine reductase